MHEISETSIIRILNKYHYHPNKIKLVQELTEDDFDRRLQFCEEIMMRSDEDNNLFTHMVFSDEATFQLNGNVNRHNRVYWSDVNPLWMRDSHTQYTQKINVWAGIIVDHVIGPFFIDENLNAVKYLNLLETRIVSAIQQLFGEEFGNVWFQ